MTPVLPLSLFWLADALPLAAVPAWQTWLFGAILAATLVMLVVEKIHKAVLVLLAAGISLFVADYLGLLGHGGSHLPVYIEMIEWEVIGIVIGATVFVEIAARSGVFTWIAVRMLKSSRGDPFKLLTLFSILTVVFSAFLDNITAMIIVGSLTIVACRKLKISPVPFLVTEGIMTNVGGLLTLISSIPNIIIGKAAGISYFEFVVYCLPYSVLAVGGSLLVARWLFGSAVAPLKDTEAREVNLRLVMAFDEWETVTDKRFFYLSIYAVIVVILAFAFKGSIPILKDFGVEVVAMGAAVFMLLLHGKDVERDLEKVEWSMVFFFIGLFTVIGVVERAGVLHQIGLFLSQLTDKTGVVGLMWFTALFSSITDNIPLAAMLAKIFGEGAVEVTRAHWWAIVFGANLGGNITPVGSASTVVAVSILKQHGLGLSFIDFVKIGGVFAALQLVLASFYLLLTSGLQV